MVGPNWAFVQLVRKNLEVEIIFKTNEFELPWKIEHENRRFKNSLSFYKEICTDI